MMASKALVALALASALSPAAARQTLADPFTPSHGDPYEQLLRHDAGSPQPDEFQDNESYARRTGAEGAQGDRRRAPDPALNPYLATPYDPYGAGGASGDRSAADPYGGRSGMSGSLDSPGAASAHPPKRAPGSGAGRSGPALLNLHADPAIPGLKELTIEREGGVDPAPSGSGDPLSPEPGAYGASPAKRRAGTLNGDSSGLLGFNPYDAKSIVAPTRAPAPRSSGATSRSLGAAGFASGLAPSPSLSGVGAGGKSSSSGSLNSSLPSSLGPAPLGPRR
ncbi:MAG: hypothetical protein JO288_06660 [Hyphomicrobiales bacterium]|nr:hypothetical protein [Hyphomicrobiales bacterium]